MIARRYDVVTMACHHIIYEQTDWRAGIVVENPRIPYLPVVRKEIGEEIWDAVSEGQAVVLTHEGRPAVVVIDIDSYEMYEWLMLQP
jgi:prevent-host-death family protein